MRGTNGEKIIKRSGRAHVSRCKSNREYPQRHPEYASKYQVYECAMVDGVTVYEGLLG